MRARVMVLTGWWLCTACGAATSGSGSAWSEPTVRPVTPQPGTVTPTGSALDLALAGPGFFVLAQGDDRRFTRLGQFTVNDEGELVTLSGWRVQGLGPNGELATLSPGHARLAPVATTMVTLRGNLAADAAISLTPSFDPVQALATTNFASSVTVYDELGRELLLMTYFRKTAEGTWDFHALTDGGWLTGGTPGVPTEVATGTLVFDRRGVLASVTQTSSFWPLNGEPHPHPLALDFGAGDTGMTQFGGTQGVSTTTFTGQDGCGPGTLTELQVDNKGEVMGTFTNGQAALLGQLALATFARAQDLLPGCDHAMQRTPLSGPPVYAAPNPASTNVLAGALELSAPWCAER